MKKVVYALFAAMLAGMAMAEENRPSEPCGGGPPGGGGSGGGSGVSSGDPNEISGPLGLGDPVTERFVKPGEWMTYTIYFENVPEATAAAQEVYVTNPLSEWLDWSTFEMGEIAFGDQIDLGLSGKGRGTCEVTMKGTNFVVKTALGASIKGKGVIDTSSAIAKTGVANWYLRVVDPTTKTGWPKDVRAGFLPPNDETFRGEGHLTYRIKVRDDAPPGTKIENSAQIVFDDNPMIETDPSWFNTVATIYEPTLDLGDGTTTNLTLIVGQPYGELPIPTAREGQTFVGWFTGENGTGRQVTAESIVQAGDSALHAHWTKNSEPTPTPIPTPAPQPEPEVGQDPTPTSESYPDYTVDFDKNGGQLPKGKTMVSQTFKYGVAAKLRKNVFTKKGYVFAGWAISKANAKKGVIAYENAQEVRDLRTDGGMTTLYAVWAKPKYKVAFYGTYKGVSGKMAAQTMKYGKKAKLKANKFTRKGYTFKGWATSKANAKKGKVAYKNKAKVKNLIITGKTVKLYAVWKKK